MNDAEFEEQKQRIEGYVTRWIPRLGLTNWLITSCHHRDPLDADGPGRSRNASVDVNWAYLTAQVCWSLPDIKEEAECECEETVVHELCHILLDEIPRRGSDSMQHLERAVTSLARAFLRTFKAGKEEGAKSVDESAIHENGTGGTEGAGAGGSAG